MVTERLSPRRFWFQRHHHPFHHITSPIYYTFWIGFFIGFLVSSFGFMFTISLTTLSESISVPFGLSSFNRITSIPQPQRYDSMVENGLQYDHSGSIRNQAVEGSTNDGWKLIHVFVGASMSNTTKRIEQMVDASTISKDYFYSTQWFSQVQQDYVVYHLLRQKQNGFFVDLAANDAIRISNTFALETYHHWDGIVIEPNSIYWSGLAYRSCNVVAAVVGQQSEQEMKFKFPKHKPAPKGGLVGPNFDNHNDKQNQQPNGGRDDDDNQMRYTVTLREIFERFNAPPVIDYFSLDIEGAETFVMESFPFDQYRFHILTVERADPRLRQLLEQNGYVQMKQLKKWGETLWMHFSILNDSSIIDLSALSIDTENYKYREKVTITTT
jgi:Methyltransferase FkbM domain